VPRSMAKSVENKPNRRLRITGYSRKNRGKQARSQL
jgi:hypothetical protein